MNKKILIIIFALLLIIAGITSVIGYKYLSDSKESKLLLRNPNTKDAYELIQKRKKDIKEDADNYSAYMSIGFNWKSIGEATKENKYLWRAVDVYSEVIKKWGPTAYLPFLNRANTYILLGEYNRAEEDIKISIELDPGEQNLPIALADLYKNYLNKSDEEIRVVYETAMDRAVGGGNIVNSYAGYLKEVGDYEKSLQYYRSLEKAFPSNTAYKSVILELETLISNNK